MDLLWSEKDILKLITLIPDFDPLKQQNHLLYLDVNNLYGFAMSQPLPVGNFQWVDIYDEDISKENIMNTKPDSPTGYILEVDLEYPENLHDDHDDYPLCPHKLKVSDEMLSPYAKKTLEKIGELRQKTVFSSNLISSFLKREKYVIHSRNLKYYIEKEMVLKKIHRAISFDKRAWLKE